MKKDYEAHEESPMKVEEPEPIYGTATIAEQQKHLPDDILIDAVRYADIAKASGRMIPHNEVYGIIANRLGWK